MLETPDEADQPFSTFLGSLAARTTSGPQAETIDRAFARLRAACRGREDCGDVLADLAAEIGAFHEETEARDPGDDGGFVWRAFGFDVDRLVSLAIGRLPGG